MSLPVVTASQASGLDRRSIASGNPARALMQRAGAAAAAEITCRYPELARHPIAIFAGPGNNGGDAWVLAAALHAAGASVHLHEAVPAATDDARAEKARALEAFSPVDPDGSERLIVDGLLGTGSSGPPRGPVALAVQRIARSRAGGATIVALDVPSALNSDTGHFDGGVPAHLTLSFGTVKRGQLLNRDACGTIVVLDIGLNLTAADCAGLPLLLRGSEMLTQLQRFPADANKGTRHRLCIVGGAPGMLGASAIAAEAAARTGIGLARLIVAPQSMAPLQSTVFKAVAAQWPETAEEARALTQDWAHALVLGPGLGQQGTRPLVKRMLENYTGPVLLDADALNVFAGDTAELAAMLHGREALLTPHALEMSRLTGVPVEEVLANRFDIAAQFAARHGVVLLLKGVPTVIASPAGEVAVSATGSPVLAAGGSGDLLAGIAGTLLAQSGDAFHAACLGAWLHGRAGELAAAVDGSRGHTLDDVLAAMPAACSERAPLPRAPVLHELPEVRG